MKYKVIFTFYEGMDRVPMSFDCDNQTVIRYMLNQVCIQLQYSDIPCNFKVYNDDYKMIERGTIEHGAIVEHFVDSL